MKVTTKTIISMLLATTVVGAGTAAADSRKPSWQDYRSTVTQMPVSKSYNDIELNKTDIDKTKTTTTTTDNSKAADDSFNKSVEIDLDKSNNPVDSYNTAKTKTDNSKSAADSFNKSVELDLDKSSRIKESYNTAKTDNSKSAADSFNKSVELDLDKSSRIKDSYNMDKSRHAADSYNTDKSRHAKDSYNTDESVNDSYNTWNNQREAAITDKMSVSQLTKSMKNVSSGDVQSGSNDGFLSGHVQSGQQGAVDVGGIGNDAPSYGGWGGGEYGYGGGADKRKFRNDQEIAVHGPNLGAVSNTNLVNQGRDLVFGPNRSAIGNDFGNKQIFSAGDQAQMLKNDQYKVGDNDAAAVDNVTNSATKSSTTSTQ